VCSSRPPSGERCTSHLVVDHDVNEATGQNQAAQLVTVAARELADALLAEGLVGPGFLTMTHVSG
jgi:hypothetical protein